MTPPALVRADRVPVKAVDPEDRRGQDDVRGASEMVVDGAVIRWPWSSSDVTRNPAHVAETRIAGPLAMRQRLDAV